MNYEYLAYKHTFECMCFIPNRYLSQVNKIWIPYIIFQNTDDGEAVKVDALTEDGNIRTLVSVTREQNFTRSGPEVADEVHLLCDMDSYIFILYYFHRLKSLKGKRILSP